MAPLGTSSKRVKLLHGSHVASYNEYPTFLQEIQSHGDQPIFPIAAPTFALMVLFYVSSLIDNQVDFQLYNHQSSSQFPYQYHRHRLFVRKVQLHLASRRVKEVDLSVGAKKRQILCTREGSDVDDSMNFKIVAGPICTSLHYWCEALYTNQTTYP